MLILSCCYHEFCKKLIEKFGNNNNVEQLIRNTVQQETINIQNQLSNLTKPLVHQVEKISQLYENTQNAAKDAVIRCENVEKAIFNENNTGRIRMEKNLLKHSYNNFTNEVGVFKEAIDNKNINNKLECLNQLIQGNAGSDKINSLTNNIKNLKDMIDNVKTDAEKAEKNL
jgi:hypothetical protein